MTHEKNMIDYMKYVASEMPIIPEREGFTEMEVQFLICNEKSIFLDSPPKLGDFIPTNEKGEVMEEPMPEDYPPGDINEGAVNYSDAVGEFKSALDRVIWKGNYSIGYLSKKNPNIEIKIGEVSFWIGNTTYNELITSGVKLERIEKK